MARIRQMYPGGNTCYGFYSFYDHIIPYDAHNKIVIKGGPGVGKSSFMKKVGQAFSENGIDIEYHWCSSDNNSLDGLVVGDRQICLVDGTAPHIVDPRFPGAVDWIINMGDFWDAGKIAENKKTIIQLTKQVGLCFERAYNRLKEAQSAWWEWGSYYREAVDSTAANRNILALTDDFLKNARKSDRPARHLFAAALTPEGIVSKVDSLIEENWAIFAVKGSPCSGIKGLFKHVEDISVLNGINAEIYHCPFDPANIDLIILPVSKMALLDISAHIADYEKYLPARKYKRMLDFDQFLNTSAIKPYEEQISASRNRFKNGLQEAIVFIQAAKVLHDELEMNYVPNMDFDRIEEFRNELIGNLLEELKGL